jgi:hypothetical protein
VKTDQVRYCRLHVILDLVVIASPRRCVFKTYMNILNISDKIACSACTDALCRVTTLWHATPGFLEKNNYYKRRARHKSQIPSLVSEFRFSIQFSEINSYTWRTNSIHTWYTRKNAQVVTSLETSCYKSVHKLSTCKLCSHCLIVSSCFNKFGTSLS